MLRAVGFTFAPYVALLLFAPAPWLNAQSNWPTWRGPTGDGVAAASARPPIEWSSEKNVRWAKDLPGEGSSTPIIWGDRVFVLAAEKTDRMGESEVPSDPRAKTPRPEHYYRFLVLCHRRDTGEELWRKVATEVVPHEGRHPTNTYASSSPVTDGRRLIVSFGSYGVFAFDLDGKELWRRDLGRMRTRYGWGEAASPALHGNRVIINWDHEDQSFIVCLNATNGELVWKKQRDEPTSWATPRIVTFQGVTQVIVNGTNRVRSYDLKTGDVIWQCGGQTVNAIPSPIVDGDVVYCLSGYRGSAAYAIPLSSRGDITDRADAIRWRLSEATPYVPSPVAYRGQLYFSRTNQAILTSVSLKDGRTIFGPQRLPSIRSMYGSPVAANSLIYCVGREGETVVLRAGKTLDVAAVNKLNEPMDASPAIVDEQIFLRTARRLICIQQTESSNGD